MPLQISDGGQVAVERGLGADRFRVAFGIDPACVFAARPADQSGAVIAKF